MRPFLLPAALAAAVLATSAYAKAKPEAAPAGPPPAESDWRAVDPENTMVIDTSQGRLIVELTPEVAPLMVERVKLLTRRGFYDGLTFFRVISDFMAQTGDPKNTGEGGSELPDLKGEFNFRRIPAQSNFVAVARPAGGEVGFIGALPVQSQSSALAAMTADGKVAAWGLFCPGVLGAARTEAPDSGNSQFFLMREAYPSLEKRYTAFGRVISGQEAVRRIKVGEPVPPPQDAMLKVRMLSDIPAAERPKVRVIDPRSPYFLALAERMRTARGADFSVCDIDLPVEVK